MIRFAFLLIAFFSTHAFAEQINWKYHWLEKVDIQFEIAYLQQYFSKSGLLNQITGENEIRKFNTDMIQIPVVIRYQLHPMLGIEIGSGHYFLIHAQKQRNQKQFLYPANATVITEEITHNSSSYFTDLIVGATINLNTIYFRIRQHMPLFPIHLDRYTFDASAYSALQFSIGAYL